jgi:DtxR family transcriptional regulator, Mn-dependent transcriptional regulator
VTSSETVQDYVKQIYLLQDGDGRATTSALAERMGVSAASATSMFKRLDELGLVEHVPYKGAVLTPAGEQIAMEIVRHHRLLELYLTEALGLPWDKVHREAEVLEHVLSDELEASIDAALGYPDTDPHGDPIPTADLKLPDRHHTALADLAEGQAGTVRRVPDGDPELLTYLASMGLVPRASFIVAAKAPFRGPITLEVDGASHALGVEVAERIGVEPAA